MLSVFSYLSSRSTYNKCRMSRTDSAFTIYNGYTDFHLLSSIQTLANTKNTFVLIVIVSWKVLSARKKRKICSTSHIFLKSLIYSTNFFLKLFQFECLLWHKFASLFVSIIECLSFTASTLIIACKFNLSSCLSVGLKNLVLRLWFVAPQYVSSVQRPSRP